MKQISRQSGFTIIEVMLFLGISGLLAMGLMAGMSGAIQQQQYRDAVQSFAGFLRGQYDRAVNVENARNEPLPPECGSGTDRGQSECVVVGRYIQSKSGGSASYGELYEIYPVYGRKDSGTWQYWLGEKDDEYQLRWSAKSRFSDQGHGASKISLLMYRHPEQGSLAIRSADSFYDDTTIGDFFSGDFADKREICVYDEGWLAGVRQSVFLGAKAGSSDAVTIDNASAGCQT